MRRFDGIEGLAPDQFRAPAVTIGMFDGLHRGHRHVLEHLRALADRTGGDAVVVTFATHPRAVLEGRAPGKLLSTEHRLLLMGRLGVDAVVLLPFDDALRQVTYTTFVDQVLVQGLGARALLLGFDSNFGHGGEGTIETVAPLATQHGFDLVEAPPIAVGGEPISSSRIREALRQGELAAAADMLGRPVALYGTVVPGDGRGRTIGFPTANIDLDGEMTPPPGVYHVIATLRGERRVAVANLGVRPTFTGSDTTAEPVLEVHIPSVDFAFYDERLEIEFVRKIRDEKRFDSVEALVEQIRRDVAFLG